jgi:epsilon-lactone hydrolase
MHLPRPLVRALSGPTYRISLNRRVPVAWQRRLCEVTAAGLRPPRGTLVEHVRLGGRPAERVTFGASRRPRAVLYLHGGGFVVGSARAYRALAGYLARISGSVVYTLDYRLAPEHPYPAALDDAVAAFRELVEVHGYAADRIALAGDSAGGGLAVSAARVLSDTGHRPAALGLLSPWTEPGDHEMPARDFVVNRAWGTWCGELYRAAAELTDPAIAPMHAELSGLPPMLIHTAPTEMLYAQICRFAERARAAGVDVVLAEQPALWHSAHVLAGVLREATDAVRDVGVFLRARLDPQAPTAEPISLAR